MSDKQADLAALFHTLITANHILDHHNIVDAYGHISARNPLDPTTFFLSRSLAPALVAGADDIQEYRVADAAPVDAAAPLGYKERFIHSEIYRRYADVHSVVHAHSEAVLPFGISSVPLRPVYHMGGVMGPQPPVFDIALHYRPADDPQHSLLVTTPHLGSALASAFTPRSAPSPLTRATTALKTVFTTATSSSSTSSSSTTTTTQSPAFPSCPVVLMRGHGFTCVGRTPREAVYRAVYTCGNARVQAAAMALQGQFNLGLVAEHFGNWDGGNGGGSGGGRPRGQARQEGIVFLSEREVKDSWAALEGTCARAWEVWEEEVDGAGNGRYRNDVVVEGK